MFVKSNKLNIVFLGSSKFVVPILASIVASRDLTIREIFRSQLEWLKTQQHDLIGILPNLVELEIESILKILEEEKYFDKKLSIKVVISQPDRKNRNLVISNPVVRYARTNDLPLFLPDKLNTSKQEFIENYGQELDIGMVASFGQIISTDILETANFGFLNWHPSRLPKYRGPTPMQTALKNGDIETALSWIQMTKQMDAGNVLLQLIQEIEISDTFDTLATKMSNLGANTWGLAIAIKILQAKNLTNTAAIESMIQNKDEIVFCPLLSKSDRFVDPAEQLAEDIYNQWRGFITFPGTSFQDIYFAEEVKILECKLPTDKQSLSSVEQKRFGDWIQIKMDKMLKTFLVCKDNSLLEISKIGLSSGKQINLLGFQFSEVRS